MLNGTFADQKLLDLRNQVLAELKKGPFNFDLFQLQEGLNLELNRRYPEAAAQYQKVYDHTNHPLAEHRLRALSHVDNSQFFTPNEVLPPLVNEALLRPATLESDIAEHMNKRAAKESSQLKSNINPYSVLRFLVEYDSQEGRFPLKREIRAASGLHLATVNQMLDDLEQEQLIEKFSSGTRAQYYISDKGYNLVRETQQSLPPVNLIPILANALSNPVSTFKTKTLIFNNLSSTMTKQAQPLVELTPAQLPESSLAKMKISFLLNK